MYPAMFRGYCFNPCFNGFMDKDEYLRLHNSEYSEFQPLF